MLILFFIYQPPQVNSNNNGIYLPVIEVIVDYLLLLTPGFICQTPAPAPAPGFIWTLHLVITMSSIVVNHKAFAIEHYLGGAKQVTAMLEYR